MPWLIGIDEAGYGPNLGPFVMTAVVCRLSEPRTTADLWQLLRAAVRRPHEPDDGRLLIEDSKVVYAPKEGLARLESGVLASGVAAGFADLSSLSELLDAVAPDARGELRDEAWFTGTTSLPHAVPVGTITEAQARFAAACATAEVRWGCTRSVVVCPTRFNGLLDRWGTKGAVLGQALAELLRASLAGLEAEPLLVYVDKHGGRNTYAAMLHDAFPDGFVLASEESHARSSYSIRGLDRDVTITFQPRADAEHFCVALASMVSKYLRELLMHEFNSFWQRHVPGLAATAGYPTDARRFWTAILPAVRRLGLAEERLWRRK